MAERVEYPAVSLVVAGSIPRGSIEVLDELIYGDRI